MLGLFLLFLLVPTCVYGDHSENLEIFEHNCEIYVHFMHLCYFFEYTDDCVPWNTDNCKILHYSANEPNCITIECPVSAYKTLQKYSPLISPSFIYFPFMCFYPNIKIFFVFYKYIVFFNVEFISLIVYEKKKTPTKFDNNFNPLSLITISISVKNVKLKTIQY